MKDKAKIPLHIYIILFIVFLLSLIAIFIAYIRAEPLKLDWAGFIVGGLAALSTVLVGWQIINIINLNSLQKSIHSKLNEVTDAYEKQIKITQSDLKSYTEMHAMLSLSLNSLGDKRLLSTLAAAFVALEYSFNDLCSEGKPLAIMMIQNITSLIKTSTDYEKYIIDEKEKEKYIDILLKLNDKEVLPILDIIRSLEIKEE